MSWLYKGIDFYTPQDLVYYLYCEDKKIEIGLIDTEYTISDGRKFKFRFINEGKLVLLYYPKDYKKVLAEIPAEVRIYSEKEITSMFKFIYHKHGRNYLKKFKQKTYKDFKRKVIEYDDLRSKEEFQKYKHKNVKFHYNCCSCQRDTFTTWRIIDHFEHDHLCKHCRKALMKEQKNQASSESVSEN